MKNLTKKFSVLKSWSSEGISIQFFLKSIFLFRYYFICLMILILVVGILAYSFANEEYETKSELLLEEAGDSMNLGQLSQLANVAGFNMPTQGGGGMQINPRVYEKILTSHVFLSEIMDFQFYSAEYQDSLTLREYFNLLKFEEKSLPGNSNHVNQPSNFIEEDRNLIPHYSNYERVVMNEIKSRITFSIDDETISIAIKMPEPHLSALVNYHVVEKLKEYLTNYKTERLGRNLAFIESRKDEAENRYLQAQRELANFRDRNYGVISQLAKTKEDNLQSDLTLAFNLYNALSQNVEQSKIQFQKETPLFFFIEVPIILNKPTEPKLVRYVFIYFGLGLVLFMVLYFGLLIAVLIYPVEHLTPSN